MGKVIDLTGCVFGKLQVKSRDANRGPEAYWLCICECGGQKVIRGSHLRSGQIRSCGCLSLERKNIIGNRYGKLVVLHRDGRNKFGKIFWLCQCDCGRRKRVLDANLLFEKNGKPHQGSCGCEQGIRPRGRVPAYRYVLTSYKSSAKANNRSFELPEEVFAKLLSSNCDYCGGPPEHMLSPSWTRKFADYSTFRYNGIDRIDSAKGYVEDNVVPCCKTCNELKSDKSREEFLTQIEAIHHWQNRQRAASA